MIRLYIASGLLVLAGLAYWRYDYVVTQNGELKTALQSVNGILEKERSENQAAQLRAQNYFEQRAKDDEEMENLRKCRADKSCWPRVRVKTSCPTVPSSSANAGTPESATAELAEDAERNLHRLEQEIKLITAGYIALQKEVEARSKQDFCQPK